MPELYRAQQQVVDPLAKRMIGYSSRPNGLRPIRHTIVAQTGCGKTAMAIKVAHHAKRILVLCPAIVRYHWCHEFLRWGNRADVGVVEMGRTRKTGTKKALLARDWAFQQPVQIVSYDLLKHIDVKQGWDMLIIDELHNLGDALSHQSQLVFLFTQCFPNIHILGLTATPIPTNAQQVWFPQWLMHGSAEWGKPRPSGGLSYKFAREYFEIYQNEYTQFGVGTLREDRRTALQQKIANVASFLTRADISSDLPPLDCRPLYINNLSESTYVDWHAALPEDVTHSVILCYHRQEAQNVWNLLIAARHRAPFNRILYIDGSMPPGERMLTLEACEQDSHVTLVATQESLSEGIRLMWAQKVLITEFRRSPGQVTQLLGRFQSVGDSRRPQIEIAIDEDSDGMARLLLQRVNDINAVLRSTSVPAVVSDVFKPRELTDERISSLFAGMLDSYNEDADAWADQPQAM